VGQKVNPIGLRVGITRPWSSVWYSKKKYGEFLAEDTRIRKYITKKFENVGVSKVDIERTSSAVRVKIYAKRRGLIVGKKGAGVETLRDEIKVECKIKTAELAIDIMDVKKPDTDAKLLALDVKSQLERRISFRRAMKKVMSTAIKAGAKGIKVSVSGRLGGADMARTERYHEGRVPLHTLRADIDYATAEALTAYGITGVKVWVFKGDTILESDQRA